MSYVTMTTPIGRIRTRGCIKRAFSEVRSLGWFARMNFSCCLAWGGDGPVLVAILRRHRLVIEWNRTPEERMLVSARQRS